MSRIVHCKRETYDVYIGRPGPWGNPFSHLPGKGDVQVATRDEAIERYRSWLWAEIKLERISLINLAMLSGKTLGCWCAPLPCHGNVLSAAADWAAEQIGAGRT